ncbi:MAG: 50S ribosomal protein L18 [Longimicrobiales bacterium]
MRTGRQAKREARRVRRHRRVRKKVFGRTERPRLVVHRSSKNIQGQIVDDVGGKVLVGVTTQATEEGTKTERSRAAGKRLAERAKAAGIERVVFDRGGYIYHGRVAAFADGAREGGLEF